VSVNNVPEVSE